MQKNYGQKSDILRYEILYRFGGLYVDTDFECFRSFDIFLHGLDFFVGSGFGDNFTVYNGLIASVPNHPIIKTCIENITIGNLKKKFVSSPSLNVLYTTGPYFLTRHLFKEVNNGGRCVVFPVGYFYPWPHYCRHDKGNISTWLRPETYAIHHWHAAWNDGKNLK